MDEVAHEELVVDGEPVPIEIRVRPDIGGPVWIAEVAEDTRDQWRLWVAQGPDRETAAASLLVSLRTYGKHPYSPIDPLGPPA